MPVLDSVKAALTDHLQTLIKKMTLGSGGGDASSRDGGAGSPQLSVIPNIHRIGDRTLSVSAVFDTQQSVSETLKEVVLHGETALDTPSFRAAFLPIMKDTTNEIRIDILMEVR